MSESKAAEWPEWPDPMSEPCARYVRAVLELIQYISFGPELAERVDKAREVFRRFHEAQGRSPEAEKGESAMALIGKTSDLAFEMTLSRSVDNYLAYISDLLAVVFRTRPETLRSGEKVRLDFVLQHSTMEELIGALVERRVERLSYQGLEALTRDVASSLGFELFPSGRDLAAAVEAIEYRNLIVHNRAVVNRRFLDRIPQAEVKLGERVAFEPEYVTGVMRLLGGAVTDVDNRAAEKWGVPQTVTRADAESRNKVGTSAPIGGDGHGR